MAIVKNFYTILHRDFRVVEKERLPSPPSCLCGRQYLREIFSREGESRLL